MGSAFLGAPAAGLRAPLASLLRASLGVKGSAPPRGSSGGPRRLSIVRAAGVSLGALALTAQAANAQPPASPTGPSAQPPPRPGYAAPAPGVLSPVPAPPILPRSGGPSLLISDLRIIDEPAIAKPARAKGAARQKLTNGDLTVELAPHEALDAAWVRHEFERNGLFGKPTAAARVVTLLLMLNRTFLANGYINSGVLLARQSWPPSGGALELRLVYGSVVGDPKKGRVVVEWAHGRPNGLTRSYVLDRLPAATATPLDGVAVERQFRLLADDPAIRTINAQLSPGVEPGQATLTVVVDPQPRFDNYVSISDSRSPSVGGYRVATGGSARGVAMAGDVLSGEIGTTSGLLDGTIAYAAPLTDGFTANARFSADNAAVVSQPLTSLDIRSRDRDWEYGLTKTLIALPLTPIGDTGHWSAAESLTVGLSIAHRDTSDTLLGEPFSFAPGEVNGRSSYGVLRAHLDWVERSETQVVAISTVGTFGINGTGSDVPGVVAPDPHFQAVLTQANYARRLNSGSLELLARTAFQYASGPLYSGEELAIGGATSVRGYRENLILADTGVVGSVELACQFRLGEAPCGKEVADWKSVHASLFVDGAYARNLSSPQPTPRSIDSVGLSATWRPTPALNVSVIYGHELQRVSQPGPADLQDRGVSFEVVLHPIALARSLSHPGREN